MYGVSGAFYQALSMKCDLSRAKLKLLVCGISTHVFMQMHPYNAIDISLHHIKLKFVQALLIQIKNLYYSVMT